MNKNIKIVFDLYENGEKRELYGLKARATILNHYTLNKAAQAYLELINAVSIRG